MCACGVVCFAWWVRCGGGVCVCSVHVVWGVCGVWVVDGVVRGECACGVMWQLCGGCGVVDIPRTVEQLLTEKEEWVRVRARVWRTQRWGTNVTCWGLWSPNIAINNQTNKDTCGSTTEG